ncbi:MAG: ATP:cob(I)alamin adenosyltransferase [Chloroflexota bacterium]
MTTARTGSGDAGFTDLLGHRRVAKYHPILEALGEIDEATSALGMAKAGLPEGEAHDLARGVIEAAQHDLYQLMAELAFPPQHAQARRIGEGDVQRLDAEIQRVQAAANVPARFVLPGASRESAGLDFARAVVRRAERAVVRVLHTGADDPAGDLLPDAAPQGDGREQVAGGGERQGDVDYPTSPSLAAYLNRLSLLLYVLARYEDAVSGATLRLAGSRA